MNATKSRIGKGGSSAPQSRPGNRQPPVGKKLDAGQAVRSAIGYFNSVFGKSTHLLLPETTPSLEEIEQSKDNQFWLVTLGYDAPRKNDPLLPPFLRVPARKLKIFKVNAASGEVVAMKMHPDE